MYNIKHGRTAIFHRIPDNRALHNTTNIIQRGAFTDLTGTKDALN